MQRENIIIKLKTREQCKDEQLPEWFIPVSMLGKEHQAYRVYNLNDDYYSYYIPVANGSMFTWSIPEEYIEDMRCAE